MVELKFTNSDARPKTQIIQCSEASIAPIMDWYGAFFAGDRYTVHADGVALKKDQNGSLVEPYGGPAMSETVNHTPERIWARLDSATVYMDGSSPLVARTREFRGAAEYVAASQISESVLNQSALEEAYASAPAEKRDMNLIATAIRAYIESDARSAPEGWLVIGPSDDKRVVLDAQKYNPTEPAFWVYGEIPDDASIYPLFASAYAVNGELLVAHMPDEDDIEEAITGSIDIDWTPRDAAREVMRLLAKGVNGVGRNGEHLERCCPNDPESDPKNENIQPVLKGLIDLERYLRETPHHNAPQAAAARAAIAKATGEQP